MGPKKPAAKKAVVKKPAVKKAAVKKPVSKKGAAAGKKASPKKGAAATVAATKAKKPIIRKASKTPNRDEFFAHVNRVKQSLKCAVLWINGIGDGDEEDHEGKEYSKVQIAKAKLIMVPPERKKEIDEAEKWFTSICNGGNDSEDDEFDDEIGGIMMMNTATGNNIIMSLGATLAGMSMKKIPERFNMLLGLTLILHRYDVWIHDNEMWGEGMPLDRVIQLLAKSWKDLLKKSNEQLGIDEEFTRPGVEHLMKEFAELCEDAEGVSVKFQWK